MEKSINHKVRSASLAFSFFVLHAASAMEDPEQPLTNFNALQGSIICDKPENPSEMLRSHDYYKRKLQELETSTARIHLEVDRILVEFRRNMAEYYRRTIGACVKVATKTAPDAGIQEVLKNDKIKDYDFRNFKIPCHQTIEGLQIQNNDYPINKVGVLQGSYTIEGITFKRQNVSSVRLDCFFNSVGLERNKEIEKLKANCNNPIVRYMIASEIVHNALIQEYSKSLPKRVKEAIDYKLFYEKQQAPLKTAIESVEH